MDAEFLEQVGDVGRHRAAADEERRRDLRIASAVGQKTQNLALTRGQLILACAELLRGETRTSMSPEERLVRAEEAARAGLSAGAGLATMAAAAGLGRSRFCELYTQLRGTTPGSFLRAERLTRAQELLSCPEPSIVEIAAQVGCADATVFGRFFRAATGMTPSSWRIRRRTAPR